MLYTEWADALGYGAAGLVIATYSMRTMIPLRVISLCASSLFLTYGVLVGSYPQVFLHGILLPLNAFRLRQMINLVAQVRAASQSDFSMDWLCSFSTKRNCREGEYLFRKDDLADTMLYTVSGRYLLTEIGVEIGPGQVIGEIAMVSANRRRTQSFECIEAGEVQQLSYDRVKELCFQNPKFGFYFLKLITQRLMANNAALQEHVTRLEQSNRPSKTRRRRRLAAKARAAS